MLLSCRENLWSCKFPNLASLVQGQALCIHLFDRRLTKVGNVSLHPTESRSAAGPCQTRWSDRPGNSFAPCHLAHWGGKLASILTQDLVHLETSYKIRHSYTSKPTDRNLADASSPDPLVLKVGFASPVFT